MLSGPGDCCKLIAEDLLQQQSFYSRCPLQILLYVVERVNKSNIPPEKRELYVQMILVEVIIQGGASLPLETIFSLRNILSMRPKLSSGAPLFLKQNACLGITVLLGVIGSMALVLQTLMVPYSTVIPT